MKVSLNLPDWLVDDLRDGADAIGVSMPALITAELARARSLAAQEAHALDIEGADHAIIARALQGIEQMHILDGRDDLPSADWLCATLRDMGHGDVAERLDRALPSPLAIWGLVMAARR